MNNVLLIGVGGFIGSVLRYWVSGFIQQVAKDTLFPFGTFAVNFLGCLLIGFLSQLSEDHGIFVGETRLFVFVGFLGGFTTFSTFGNETMNLLRDSQNLLAFGNITAHFVLGLVAVWLGRSIAYLIWR
jgi:fluoride exporter